MLWTRSDQRRAPLDPDKSGVVEFPISTVCAFRKAVALNFRFGQVAQLKLVLNAGCKQKSGDVKHARW